MPPEDNHLQQTAGDKRSTFSILLALFVFGMGQSFVFSSIPPIGRELGLTESQIGLIIASGAVVLVIFSLFWGRWIEYLGIRRSLQIGMFTYALSTAGLGFVFALGLEGAIDKQLVFYLAIALRVIFSAASGGVFPSAQAYFVSRSSAENRVKAIATMSIAFSIGMICGPAVAAVLTIVSLSAPFYFIAAIAFLSGVLLQLFLHKTAHQKEAAVLPRIDWLRHPATAMLVMLFLMNICLTGSQQVLVFYLQDLFRLDAEQAAQQGGVAMALLSASMIMVQIVATQALGWKPSRLIYCGVASLLLSMLLFLWSETWIIYLLASAVLGAAFGVLYPSIVAIQSILCKPHEQKRMASSNVTAQGSGLIFGPAVCATLYQAKPEWPFLLVAAISVVMAVFFSLWLARHRELSDAI